MKSPNLYQKLVSQILSNVSNQRTKEIIELRYGLNDGQRNTLEFIGQKYGITRERVRQIEEAAFLDLKKDKYLSILQPAFNAIDIYFNKQGKLCREQRLLADLTGSRQPDPSWGALYFILTIGQPYQRYVETDKFFPFWTNDKSIAPVADNLVTSLTEKIKQENKPLADKLIYKFAQEFDSTINRNAIDSYLDATKLISQNSFDQYGLSFWPEINPRGAKDKAYIILKEKGQPLHFQEVTQFINDANLGKNVAQAQTVHNELIKDSRFILVGRGTYALKEWGYEPGTVKDVIIKVLKDNGPLSKEKITSKVLDMRLVKENTILINLQNKQFFKRDNQGRYVLAK